MVAASLAEGVAVEDVDAAGVGDDDASGVGVSMERRGGDGVAVGDPLPTARLGATASMDREGPLGEGSQDGAACRVAAGACACELNIPQVDVSVGLVKANQPAAAVPAAIRIAQVRRECQVWWRARRVRFRPIVRRRRTDR